MANDTEKSFPLLSFRFRIEFQSVTAGGFAECSGLQVETEVEEHREGDLHRSGVMRLATAADEILPMKDPRVKNNPSNLAVIVLSRVIKRLGVRWDVREALPVKWGVSELKADGNTVAVETLELVHHGFTRAE